MKIIFSNTIFFEQKTGGISRYFVNLLEYLTKQKVKSLIIAPLSKNLYLKNLKKNKISFYINRFPNWRILQKINNFFFKYISFKYRPNIVHETYYNKENLEFFKNKIKIITIYDLIHEKFKKKYSNRKVPNKIDIVHYSDHFICISKKTQKDFISYYKISPKKTSVVYLGADHLKKKFKKFKKIIIIEDHSKIGGLSSIIKESAYDQLYKGKILSFSLKDEFIHCYGNQDDLLNKHGISSKKLYKKTSEILL